MTNRRGFNDNGRSALSALAASVGLILVGVVVSLAQARPLPVTAAHEPVIPTPTDMIGGFESYPVEADVYSIAYDATRNSLWYASMSDRGADYLWQFGIADRSRRSTLLPETTHNGFLERVRVAPDGSIWLTEEYTLVRYDPATDTLSSIDLAQEDRDATADALAEDSYSPGTWPSGIAFDMSGNVLVARHNVNALIKFDPQLREVGRVPLPDGFGGPGDIAASGSVIYVTQYHRGHTITIDELGNLIGTVAAGGGELAVFGSNVIVTGSDGTALIAAASRELMIVGSGSPDDLAAASSTLGVVYDAARGNIMEITPGGAYGTVFSVPSRPLFVDSPFGEMVQTITRDEIGALAIDSRGAVWVGDVTSRSLVRVTAGEPL